ncbi:ribonuclease R [Lachnospira multipara]|uniref:ribonuclease R n=1 Tax=Lachnospira multipara TaxID=28051 RepID=UPI000480A902|nr:ribonuclease R [Lachnospira multipara]
MKDEIFKERKDMIEDLIVRNEFYVPMKTKEIAILLNVPKSERPVLQEILDCLVSEGKIGITKKGKYIKAENVALIGTFTMTSKGFGFVTIEDREDDIFIKSSDTLNAFHMDRVKLVITKEKKADKHAEGKIVGIVEHGITSLVGTFQKGKGFGFVVPDNGKISVDIFIPKEYCMGAVDGSKVVCKIHNYGKPGKSPEGRITEIIGHINDPGTDIMSVIRGYDLPLEFPDDVIKELRKIPEKVDEKDKAGRVDLRNLTTVTIDGEDAKDLDDAITLSKEGDIYKLGVHIADVSHYVTENSPLDKEAIKRGTSVYLVDRVIPMLPHQLSNGICSLNQGEDRLALSCLMDIDSKGNVVDHRICETLINVDRRMSYTSVKKIIIDKDEEESKKYADLVDMFFLMEECANLLRNKRFSRGSIDFDFPESKIELDDKGHPVKIAPYERTTANKIIEDFMLIANETVAEDFFWQELPFLYRTHENPDPEKMMKLSTFINNFGYSIRLGDEIHPKEIQKLLSKIEGSQEEILISRLALRSMKKARYTTECIGHFGLAAKYYCHFTSPIRRYPDLQIHRIIKENLHGGINKKRIDHYNQILPEIALSTSNTERRADEAERDTDKIKMCEYMAEHIGEIYEGVISGVTSWGIYVELPNTIEGMVSVNNMHGYYEFDENHYEMVECVTNKTYKLGQKVEVVTISTDKLQKTIDFKFLEDCYEDEIKR